MTEPSESRNTTVLSLAQAWLPILTAVCGAVWAVYIFTNQQAESATQATCQVATEARTRLIEAQKPFLTKQLDLYFETTKVVGVLLTAQSGSPGYEAASARFTQLYWSDLGIVEDNTVASAMVDFNKAFDAYDHNPSADTKGPLEQSSLQLSHAIRAGIEASWGAGHPNAGVLTLAVAPEKCAELRIDNSKG